MSSYTCFSPLAAVSVIVVAFDVVAFIVAVAVDPRGDAAAVAIVVVVVVVKPHV